MSRGRLLAAGAVLVAAVAGTIAYAASDTAHYPVPEAICDLRVAPSALESLLPEGERLEQRDGAPVRDLDAVLWMCDLTVDGDHVMTAVISQRSGGMSARERYDETPAAYGITSGRDTVIGGEDAVVGEDGVLVHTSCGGRGDADTSLEINVRYVAGEVGQEQAVDALGELAGSLLESATAEFGCS
jgi:hypothetical protein